MQKISLLIAQLIFVNLIDFNQGNSMQSLNIGDTIYLQKQNVSQLKVLKAKILNIDASYILLDNGLGWKCKWELDTGELIYLESPLKNQSDGIFRQVENEKLGELLILKYILANKLRNIVNQAQGILDTNEIFAEELGLLKGLDSYIDEYIDARDTYIRYSMANRNFD